MHISHNSKSLISDNNLSNAKATIRLISVSMYAFFTLVKIFIVTKNLRFFVIT